VANAHTANTVRMAAAWRTAALAVALCALLLLPSSALAAPPTLVSVPSDTASSGGVHSSLPLLPNVTVVPDLAGKGRNGYVGVFTHAAPYFSVQANTENCTGLSKVSDQAAAHNCRYATNAGPFSSLIKGGCIGAVISQGHTAASDFASTHTMFGLTASGDWLLGNVGSASQAKELGVTELVTGFNWLVYNSSITVAQAGGELAPRTAVGVDTMGRLLIVEVDGCEKCPSGKGFTMKQIAEFMVSPKVNAVHAINLDGGGSSTFYANGKVIDYPTCFDIPYKCERKVANILCVA